MKRKNNYGRRMVGVRTIDGIDELATEVLLSGRRTEIMNQSKHGFKLLFCMVLWCPPMECFSMLIFVKNLVYTLCCKPWVFL